MKHKAVCLFLFLLVSITSFSQTKLDSIRYSKDFYISYGGVFTGTGDMFGHKVYLGHQFMLNKWLGIDLNAAGSFINHTLYLEGNPEWERVEHSNGIELSANLLPKLRLGKIHLSAFGGPTIRYSYEYHANYYGVRLNPDTGGYDYFCEYYENLGFRAGYNFGVNIEFNVYRRLFIGPKFAISHFPWSGYIFSSLGLQFRWE